ncbi:unnamed protein product [Rotaria sp. Silwood2]|nr:unnamed protein product [Rotaria sp. Silwood2]CAF4016215.1 unnamed protein product [Rotaria sp. Silwood2]
MEQGEYLYSGNSWFKERLDGPDGHLWRRARKMFLFNQNLSSALNLFKFDYTAIKTISRPEGTVLQGSRDTTLNSNHDREYRPGQAWADDAQNSIRTLLDRIVTRWIPNYMYASKINTEKLHPSLTSVPLKLVQTIYDKTNDDIDTFNVNKALATYQACLVPLHYHELWSEIARDFKNVDITLKERETEISFKLFYNKTTLDEEKDSALIFGTNRVTFADNYKPLSKKLGLFDLVLITINNMRYFGMIIHVEQIKVKVACEKECSNNNHTTNTNHNELEFELQTTIGVYVSSACSDAIEQYGKQNKDDKVSVCKLSNISSSRRMISAINNIQEWPQYRSLLKPMIDDIYFQLPTDCDLLNITPTNGFNMAQSKIIAIAECMFDDIQEHLHLVHGPPGTGKSRTIAGIVLKLLSKLPESGRKQKILLCAPSNNACDELSRRILDEFVNQNILYKHGTLVRIGCQPPDDYHLCDHFLDFMILQDMVNALKIEQRLNTNLAKETEARIVRHAKIVVSTLNYCGSTRLLPLKSSTVFVIIDEGKFYYCPIITSGLRKKMLQVYLIRLEADFLLPLRFKCAKLMLVGDPLQLPPCVLSDAGTTYGLSQSLYARLYSIFEKHSDGPISMLDIQYRMHPSICRFPSEYFYTNRLLTDDSVIRRMMHFTLQPLYLYNMTKSPHSADSASSSFNAGEARCIQHICKLLIAHLALQPAAVSTESEDDEDDDESSNTSSSNSTHYSDDDSDYETTTEKIFLQPLSNNDPRSIEAQQRIAVITPYKAQVRLLRSYLPPYIEIMTVDSSQGKEKDIVIISCVRSGGTIGFLDDMHRVNVMLTRSKNALYVVGNLSQLASQHDGWNAFFEHARLNRIICDVNMILPDLPYRR